MNKSKILSFIGIVSIVFVLIGAVNKLTIDQQRLNATMSGVSLVGSVPIGGMVAVNPTMQASDAWQPPATGVIKDGFMRADGHTITAQNVTDGSMLRAGTILPNMVTKYPRGNTTSGSTGGANTQASNVIVGNHATLALSDHNAIDIAHGHGFTNPYVPSHYHTLSTSNTFSVSISHDHANQNFTSSGQSQNHTHLSYPASGAGSSWWGIGLSISGNNAPSGTAWAQTGGVSQDHTHTISVDIGNYTGSSTASSGLVSGNIGNTGGCNGDAGNTCQTTGGSVTSLGTTNKSISSHSFSQNIDAHSVTNNAVNNEPAYVEVVWVIRVK